MVSKLQDVHLNGSHQISLDGALLDENDPTYTLNQSLVLHRNIVIENSKFTVTKSFNIAVAYTKNVIIRNNLQIDSGTNNYSQPIHIEDRSRNISIIGNTMKSKQIGILIFSSNKVGHGQGRTFTPAELATRGSGNILIRNNRVEGAVLAVQSTFLNGFLTFEGDNRLTSRGRALAVIKSTQDNTTKLTINDQTRLKGQLYSAVKAIPVNLTRDLYYTSDIVPQ